MPPTVLSRKLIVIQGHGCLNDIYASVEKAVTLKGWESVDLVIIGGDFQVSPQARLIWSVADVMNQV